MCVAMCNTNFEHIANLLFVINNVTDTLMKKYAQLYYNFLPKT